MYDTMTLYNEKAVYTMTEHNITESVPQRNGQKKRGRKKEKKKSLFKRIIMAVLAVFITACLAMCCYAGVIIIKAPKIDPSNIYETLNESSILYDQNGKEVSKVYAGTDGNRTNIEYSEIPEDMINAIVAIEDKTFWKHHGFNIIRIFGAIKDSLFNSTSISGTSTLTQQLARNIYLTNERSLNRKIKEAYYTVCLERNLTKEQIIEAYLNTINLGYGCYGIQSAAQAYFSKDAKDLNLLECASLAALPQSPTTNALVLRYEKGTVSKDDSNIIKTDSSWIYYYNGDTSKQRRDTVLEFMCEQGYISEAQRDEALNDDLRDDIKLGASSSSSFASYFTDYVIQEVIADLVEQEGMSESQAAQYVYSGGLKIYTTLDSKAQKIVEKEYRNAGNFPGISYLNTDSSGNIINEGAITLYAYSNFFDSEGSFTLKPDEYKWRKDGSLVLYKDKRLNFYETEYEGETDCNIEFKDLYIQENGIFYTVEGGVVSIDAKYKTKTDKGNVIISADFFDDHPDFFTETSSGLMIAQTGYTLRQKVRQPQSSMVILDNKTGQIKAMIGGRDTEGNMLYNRAESPRQPGSSIKPLAVYSAALQQGADAAAAGKKQTFSYTFDKNNDSSYGGWWTANSYINDAKMTVNGQVWPKNWYNDYRGWMTFRTAVEQSVNVCAVKVFSEVGADYSASQLEKFGITTVVKDGAVNDMNAAALALGGMTKGVSPLQMAGAYAALANLGTYNEPVAYTQVCDRNGDVILKSQSDTEEVLDEAVAWIMDDILRTTVSNGIANQASISSQPAAGKTGTTTDNYDAWFCGFTPQYTAAVWIGNDVNIELTEGSGAAARLWSTIMNQVCSQFEYSGFPSAPSGVTKSGGEYFVKGTEQSIAKPLDVGEVELEICKDTGELATPWCKNVEKERFEEGKEPKYYCHTHNQNQEKYPVREKYRTPADVNKEEENENPDDTPQEPVEPDPEQPAE